MTDTNTQAEATEVEVTAEPTVAEVTPEVVATEETSAPVAEGDCVIYILKYNKHSCKMGCFLYLTKRLK